MNCFLLCSGGNILDRLYTKRTTVRVIFIYGVFTVLLFSGKARVFDNLRKETALANASMRPCSRETFQPYAANLEPFVLSEKGWQALCDRSVSHLGTQRKLSDSLLRGLQRGNLNIAIAGGSCSVGSGCDADSEQRWYNKMHAVMQQFLDQTQSSVLIKTINLSQGGTGADRLFYCYEEFLRLMNVSQIDVLILEYAINDGTAIWVELFIQQLPRTTAVFFLETFSAAPHTRRAFGTSQRLHDDLARYYDIPVISARDALWDCFQQSINLRDMWFASDQHHPSCFGHSTLGIFAANIMILALKSVTERSIRTTNETSYGGMLDVLNEKPPEVLISSSPVCLLASAGAPPNCTEDGFECERRGNTVDRFSEWSTRGSSWIINSSRKPSFDCTSTQNGELNIPINCTENVHGGSRDFCQVLIGFTKSWEPRGKAIATLNGSSYTIDSHAPEWSQTHWTLHWYTPIDVRALQVPTGHTSLRISCTHTSASEDMNPTEDDNGANDSMDSPTLFQLNSIIIV